MPRLNDEQQLELDRNLGRLLMRYIDRMADHCEVDTAETIVDEIVEEGSLLILGAWAEAEGT